MKAIEKITRASHLIDMDDIIREGNPTLRAVAEDVTFPLSDQEIILGEKMMQFLHHSQDPVMAEKLGLRGGVGLAAPQLDISKRIIAVLVPNPEDADGEPHSLGRCGQQRDSLPRRQAPHLEQNERQPLDCT